MVHAAMHRDMCAVPRIAAALGSILLAVRQAEHVPLGQIRPGSTWVRLTELFGVSFFTEHIMISRDRCGRHFAIH